MTTRKKTGSDRGGKKASKKVELSLDDLDRVVGGRASSLIPEEQAANAMAAAVERPMPGKVSNTSALRGNTPACCNTTVRAQRCKLRARL